MTQRRDPRRLRAAAQRRGRCGRSPTRRVCRSESDWLVGINGTRAMTAFNSKSGGFQLTTVGRVQTPTLAILVEREEKIRAFRAARLLGSARHVSRRPAASTPAAGSTRTSRSRRRRRRARRAALGRGAGAQRSPRNARASRAPSPKRPSPRRSCPPLLYDLTSLQREANGRFGLSARTTLSLAQALYEKHKVLTYPRTDSRALPEDYLRHGQGRRSKRCANRTPTRRSPAQILKAKWVKPNKRIFDNSKISDHFAIIPDAAAPKT